MAGAALWSLAFRLRGRRSALELTCAARMSVFGSRLGGMSLRDVFGRGVFDVLVGEFGEWGGFCGSVGMTSRVPFLMFLVVGDVSLAVCLRNMSLNISCKKGMSCAAL